MADRNMTLLKPYAGKGWMLNIYQTIRPSSAYGLTGTSAQVYPYVYMDGDGTEHYFVDTDDGYIDEDGLNLKLEVTSSGYTITDRSETVMSFSSSGNITSIRDADDNEITYTYSDGYITKVTDGNGQSMNLAYDSAGYLTSITDHASRVTSYAYSSDRLSFITYHDGRTSTYGYDGDGNLVSMTSYDDTKLEFTYTSLASGKKVTSVTEKAGSNIGQTLRYEREQLNVTEIISSGRDNIIDTSDDVTSELQYDSAGRLLTLHIYDENGDLGSSSMDYTASSPNSSYSNIRYINRMYQYGESSPNVHNLLIGHSGESTTSWKPLQSLGNATFTFESTAEEHIYGEKSLKISASACEGAETRSRFYQDHNTTWIKPNTTYTASAYIKTKDIVPIEGASGYGAAILAYVNAPSLTSDEFPTADDFVTEFITGTTDEAINDGWRRVSVTFTTPSDVQYVRFNGIIRGATGTAYFDGMQLEEGDSASPYNMIENSSFERTTDSFPDFWSGYVLTSSEISVTAQKKDGSRAMRFSPSVGYNRRIFQDIAITGSESDTYIISGWGYGKGVKQTGDERKFKISIKITYSDGSTKWQSPLEFNTSISGWQYGAKMFNLSDGTDTKKTPVMISPYMMMYNQASTLYFDHVQLIRSDTDKTSLDSDGNVIRGQNGTYTYDENGNMLTAKDLLSRVTNYEYDDNNNLTDITTHSGLHSDMTYDAHGNITSAMITSRDGSRKILSESVYDETGSFLISSRDEDGNEENYIYDTAKGLLLSYTDPMNRVTSYAYSSNDLLSSVTSGSRSISYSYDEDSRLEEITSGNTSYGFEYDAFGNRTAASAGDNELSEVTYGSYNGDVETVTLGNGYEKSYEYDNAGRVINERHNDELIIEYIYNNHGDIDRIIDHRANETYRYEYDHRRRVIGIHAFDNETDAFDDNRLRGIMLGYDEYNRLENEIVYEGDHKEIKNYTYGSEDKITTYHDGDYTYRLYYDTLDRASGGGNGAYYYNYQYKSSSRGNSYATGKISREVIKGIKYFYEYDSNGNITRIDAENEDGWNGDEYYITYEYDDHDQLTEEYYSLDDRTISYTYDASGNITSKRVSEDGSTRTYSYSYGNTDWHDQLTSYDGQAITYDDIGNPLSYRGYAFTWNGRELASASKGNTAISYEYDASSLRRSKTVNGVTTTYDYIDGKLYHEKRGNDDFWYSYDTNGNLSRIEINDTVYHVYVNIRGEVDRIYNDDGELEASYRYDAYGNTVSITDAYGEEITDTTNIGHVNRIRYKGYYYDSETGLYYLNSRYYDPEVGRFISADGEISSVGGDIRGYNLYSYCMNNPVNMSDPNGNWPNWAKIAIGAAAITVGIIATVATGGAVVPVLVASLKIAATSTAIGAVSSAGISVVNHRVSTGGWKDAGKAAVTGAIDGACDGFMLGGITAGASFVTLAAKGIKVKEIGKLKPSNKPGDGYSGVKYQAPKANGKYTTRSIELHSPHKSGPHNVWHWQQNTWNPHNNSITGSAKHWTIWGKPL